MEWEIWFADGGRLDSRGNDWPAGAAGVLVVRVWNHPKWGDMVLWGDAYYGHPLSLAMEGRVSDAEFERVLKEAQAQVIPPSER